MENKQQMSLDIRKTTSIDTPSGGKIWHQGVILRKASRFLTGGPTDAIIPIDVFYDPISGEICREGLPLELKNLLDAKEE